MTYQVKTFGDIIDAIIDRGKISKTPAEREKVKNRANAQYSIIGYSRPYTWSGDSCTLTLKASYSEGTATFTSGSQDVTCVDTNFTQDHEGWKIYNQPARFIYTIKRVNSATSITLDVPYNGTTISGSTFTAFKQDYGMPPNFMDPRSIRIPQMNQPILKVGTDRFEEESQMVPAQTGFPRIFTMDGLNYYHERTWGTFLLSTDFFEDDPDVVVPRNRNIKIFPAVLSQDTVASVRYTRFLEPMINETDEPLIPYENRYIIVLKTLLENFIIERDFVTKREWAKEYDDMLKKMAADINTTQNATQLVVDRTRNGFISQYGYNNRRGFYNP